MTTTPDRTFARGGLSFKAIAGARVRGEWNESDHPRDRLGRFIETGAEVRVWGGVGGTVVRNVGGGRIEIERTDGQHVIVHRNYLTVVARPDGSAPTDQQGEDVKPLTEEAPSADAVEEATPETPDVATGQMGEEVASGISDAAVAEEVRTAASAYEAAVSNNVPDDEADERAALLAALDRADAAGADEAAVDRLREAATAEPTDQPVDDASGTIAPEAPARLVDTIKPGLTATINGTEVTVGDYARGPLGNEGWVVGFTARGGAIIRREDGADVPFTPNAQVDYTPELDLPRDQRMPADWTQPTEQPQRPAPAEEPVTVQPRVEDPGYPLPPRPAEPEAPTDPVEQARARLRAFAADRRQRGTQAALDNADRADALASAEEARVSPSGGVIATRFADGWQINATANGSMLGPGSFYIADDRLDAYLANLDDLGIPFGDTDALTARWSDRATKRRDQQALLSLVTDERAAQEAERPAQPPQETPATPEAPPAPPVTPEAPQPPQEQPQPEQPPTPEPPAEIDPASYDSPLAQRLRDDPDDTLPYILASTHGWIQGISDGDAARLLGMAATTLRGNPDDVERAYGQLDGAPDRMRALLAHPNVANNSRTSRRIAEVADALERRMAEGPRSRPEPEAPQQPETPEAPSFNVGDRVVASNPGSPLSVNGTVEGTDDNGFLLVRHTNRHGVSVVGRFNPSSVRSADEPQPEPETPDAPPLPATAYRTQAEAEAAGFTFGEVTVPGDVEVGQTVIAYTRGRWRQARIVSTGRTNVKIEYTTQGAIDESQRLRDMHAARDPQGEYDAVLAQEQRNWDYYQRETQLTPDSAAQAMIDRGYNPDHPNVANERRWATERAERAQQFLRDNPDRDQFARRKAEVRMADAIEERDRARAMTREDVVAAAHMTTFNARATTLGVQRAEVPAEKPLPPVDLDHIDPETDPRHATLLGALEGTISSRSGYNESHLNRNARIVNDPETRFSRGGQWVVSRTDEGGDHWQVYTAGEGVSIGTFGMAQSRAEALAIANRLEEVLDANGDPFPAGSREGRNMVTSWRAADGQSLGYHARAVRDSIEVSNRVDAEWETPLAEARAFPFDDDATERIYQDWDEANNLDLSTARDDVGLARLRRRARTIALDEHTRVIDGGNFIVTRNPNGESNWLVVLAGSGSGLGPQGTCQSRDEAVALAVELQRRVGPDLHIGDGEGMVREQFVAGWRNANNVPFTQHLRDARAATPRGEWSDADFREPIEQRGDPVAPPAIADVESDPHGRLDPDDVSPAQMRRNLLDTFNYTHPETGWTTADLGDVEDDGYGRYVYRSNIIDRDGLHIGEVTRSVFRNHNGELEVHHDLLVIEREHQGQGFADAYYEHLYEQYENRGVEVVTIQANIDIGGYAWAQRGFDWESGTPDYYAQGRIIENLRKLTRGEGQNARRSPEEVRRIEALIERVRDGGMSPKDIANSLKDIEWMHTIPGGAQVRMWPGKFAMLGTNWHGKFYVSQRESATPDVPAYEATGLDIDSADIYEVNSERASMRALLARQIEAGADGSNPARRLTEGRIAMLDARHQVLYGEAARAEVGSNLAYVHYSDLTPSDRIILSPTDEDIPRVLRFDSRYGNMLQVTDEETGDTFEITVRGDEVFRLPARPTDPTGRALPMQGVPEDEARRNMLAMFGYTDPDTGWHTDFETVEFRYGGTHGICSGVIRDRDGNSVGRITRSIYPDAATGEIEVHHDLLSIRPAYQGGGFANAYYEHLYREYENRGVDKVTIMANIDVGGYAWAQRGFDWESGNMPSGVRGQVTRKLNSLAINGANGFTPTPEQRDRIQALAVRINDPSERLSPKDIANALSDIEWRKPIGNGDTTVRMWPGKHALLDLTWNGVMRVNASERRDEPDAPVVVIGDADVTTMTERDLEDEAERYMAEDRGINWLSDSGYDDLAGQAVQRLLAIRAEQERRYNVFADQMIGNTREHVDAGDLRAGDRIVVPWMMRHVPVGSVSNDPEISEVIEVLDAEEIGGDRVQRVRVRAGDGTVLTHSFTRFSGYDVRRDGGSANPVSTEQVVARDLRRGDRFLAEDYRTGSREAVEIVSDITTNGDYLDFNVRWPNGTVESFSLNPYSVETRVHGEVASDEPPAPTPPGDLSDDDLTAEVGALISRLVIMQLDGNVGDDYHRMDARLTALQAEQDRRRAPAEVPEPEAPEVEQPVAVREQSGPLARPVLYTYQRKNLVALGLDLPSSGAPDDVQQAAARVRARQPLTADQSAALAEHLRAIAADPATRIRRQRMLNRLAATFDASQARSLGQTVRKDNPREGVTKGRPDGIGEGDTVVVVGRGGALETLAVVGTRRMMGGRLTEITYQRPDGTTESRLLQRDQDVYILPPPPAPEPVLPENLRELVAPTAINVGDTIRIMRAGQYVDVEVQDVQPGTFADAAAVITYTNDRGYETTHPLDRDRVFIRSARGAASADQPLGFRIPDDAPRPEMIDEADIVVGDRIEFAYDNGNAEARGTITGITTVTGDDGTERRVFTLLDESGAEVTMPATGARRARLSGSATNVIGAVTAIRAQTERDHQRNQLAQVLNTAQANAYRLMAGRAGMAVGHSREMVLTEIATARERGIISDSSRMALGRHITRMFGPNANPAGLTNSNMAVLRGVSNDAYETFARAIREAEPLPGEAEHEMLGRIVGMYAMTPPERHMGRVAASLIQAAEDAARDAGGGSDDPEPPELPEGTDLRARMDAYRAQMGGAPFGHTAMRSPQYGDIDVDALDRGELPPIEVGQSDLRDVATDGGPGATAMQHLELVRAAGTDLRRRMREHEADVIREISDEFGLDIPEGDAIDAWIARVNAERDTLRDQYHALVNRRLYSRRTPDTHPPLTDEENESLPAVREARDAAIKRATDAAKVNGELRRRTAYRALSEVRDLGGKRLTYDLMANTTSRNRERHERLMNGMRQAEDVLPTDWLESIRGYVQGVQRRSAGDARSRVATGSDVISLTESDRGGAGYYGNMTLDNYENRNLTLSGQANTGVAVHELTHFAQRSVPGLTVAEQAFLWSRTSTGEPGERTRETLVNYAGRGGDRLQYGYLDAFPLPYTGVDYLQSRNRNGTRRTNEAYEVMTTGVEALFGGANYLDADFERFVLGSLALLGDPRPPRDSHEPIARPEAQPTPRRPRTPRATPSGDAPATTPRRRSRTVNPAVFLRTEDRTLRRLNDPDLDPAIKQAMHDTFGYEHAGTGFKVEINEQSSYVRGDRAQVRGKVLNRDGAAVGSVVRTVTYHPNGRIEVHHDFLALDPAVQGGGFANDYYEHLYDKYEALGVTDVTIQANIDVGGYAWAQRGFGWASSRGPTSRTQYRMRSGLRTVLARDDLTPEQKAEVQALLDRLMAMSVGREPWMSPKDFANSLKHITWQHTLPSGETITMWPGKKLMLGTNWNGIYRTGVRRQTG